MGKPKKRKRLLCGGLALGLAGALSGGAFAASAPVPTQAGKTAVGVQTVDMAPSSLSYTVPLYLTVAAAGGAADSRVVVPDGYGLKNTTGSAADGTYPGIVVSNVQVRGVEGGTWSLKAAPASGKEIRLSVGGLVLPDVTAGNTTPKDADITGSDNSFYNKADEAYRLIPGGPGAPTVPLPIEGALPSGFVATDEKAAAQFRIKYTVSLLDGGGEPIGISYEGPSKEDMANPGTSPAP